MRSFSQWIAPTLKPVTISPPIWMTFRATVSHICPGPNFGYRNCSISEVSVSF
jgi:hypothetical protein